MVKIRWISLVVSFFFYTVFINVLCHNKTTAPLTKEINQGWEIWQNRNCQACHQLYGLGGYMGPDLTNSTSKVDVAYIKAVIKSGTSRMPNFNLSDNEIEKVIAFLKWVDKSGPSAVDFKNVHWTGTYIID